MKLKKVKDKTIYQCKYLTERAILTCDKFIFKNFNAMIMPENIWNFVSNPKVKPNDFLFIYATEKNDYPLDQHGTKKDFLNFMENLIKDSCDGITNLMLVATDDKYLIVWSFNEEYFKKNYKELTKEQSFPNEKPAIKQFQQVFDTLQSHTEDFLAYVEMSYKDARKFGYSYDELIKPSKTTIKELAKEGIDIIDLNKRVEYAWNKQENDVNNQVVYAKNTKIKSKSFMDK